MSVTPNKLVVYGSANMPEADGATVGGAVDFTKRVVFYNVSPAGTLDAVSSSSSDTAVNLSFAGRDSSGVVRTVTGATLNGTTPVTGLGSSVQIERLLYGVIKGGAIGPLTDPGGSTAVGDVALYAHTAVLAARTARTGSANVSGATPPLLYLQTGDGASCSVGMIVRITSNTGVNQLKMIVATTGYGTDVVAVNRDWTVVPDNTSQYSILQGMLFEVLPNPVTAITRLFATTGADFPGGSQRVFYEKFFAVNNDTVSAALSAALEILSESPSLPSGALLDLGLAGALNDSLTIANRQTAPAGIVFTTQPESIPVTANGGNLPSGAAPNSASAQGCWARLTLPAGTNPYEGSALILISCITT